MTLHWASLLTNRQVVDALYTAVPPLDGVTVCSVHLDRAGPGLTLRLALPRFPDRPPAAWTEDDAYDRFQCQVQFGGVDALEMRGWRAGVVADVTLERDGVRRVRVGVVGEGMELRFGAADDLRVGKLSAFRTGQDGERHAYLGKVDQRLYGHGVPQVWERRFHGRV
jgi:Immunity protein 50